MTKQKRTKALKAIVDKLAITKGDNQEPVSNEERAAFSAFINTAAELSENEFMALIRALNERMRGEKGTELNEASMIEFKRVIEARIKERVEKELEKRLPGHYPYSTEVIKGTLNPQKAGETQIKCIDCLLYTSDAADE